MKHIFIISNLLAEQISLNIIQFEKIKIEDVIFIVRNSHEPISNVQWLRDPTLNMSGYFPTLNLKEVLRSHFKFKKWLKENINQRFHLYSPNAAVNFFRLIAASKLCASYCFFEEGLGAYQNHYWETNLNLRNILHDYVYPFSLIRKNVLLDTGYRRLYRLNTLAYAGRERTIDLPNNFTMSTPQSCFVKGAHVFILQTMKWFSTEFANDYWVACEKIMKKIPDNQVVYVKLHPEQTAGTELEQVNLLCSLHHCEIVPQHVFLENELAASPSLNIYTLTSSVILYQTGDHKVYNILEHMQNIPEIEKNSFISKMPNALRAKYGLA